MYLCNTIAPERLGGKNGQISPKAAPPDSQGQPQDKGTGWKDTGVSS